MGCPLMLTEVCDNIHLVFHQGDERRDHDGCSFHQQRWQLIAQRLTTTCRHEHERIIAIQQVLDNLLLVSLELVETKVFLQGLCQIFLFTHICLVFRLSHILHTRLRQLFFHILWRHTKFLYFPRG